MSFSWNKEDLKSRLFIVVTIYNTYVQNVKYLLSKFKIKLSYSFCILVPMKMNSITRKIRKCMFKKNGNLDFLVMNKCRLIWHALVAIIKNGNMWTSHDKYQNRGLRKIFLKSLCLSYMQWQLLSFKVSYLLPKKCKPIFGKDFIKETFL